MAEFKDNKMTEAEVQKKAEKKAKKQAIRTAQKEAYAKMIVAIEKCSDKAVKDAFEAYKAVKGAKREASGTATYAKFVQFVVEKNAIHEDEVFKAFRIGRKDCAGFIRKYLRNCEPAQRVWINFTPSDGMYKVIAKGVKAPKEYTGYVPTDDITDLKAPNLK